MNTLFHGRFSVISALLILIGLRVLNCSHIHLSKLQVHVNSQINVTIPCCCFILFHYSSVHAGLPSWYTNTGRYHFNERIFFIIVEKYFVTKNEKN